MGPGKIFLPGSGQPFPGLENFILKMPNFQFFPSGQKISSGWVKKYSGQSLSGILFTAGQKYARVESGPISRQDSYKGVDPLPLLLFHSQTSFHATITSSLDSLFLSTYVQGISLINDYIFKSYCLHLHKKLPSASALVRALCDLINRKALTQYKHTCHFVDSKLTN